MNTERLAAPAAQAVLNVIHSYAWGYDENDAELLSSAFADDAVTAGTIAESGVGWGPWKGRDAIVNGLLEIREQQDDRRFHQMSTPVFLSLTQDRAVVNLYLSVLGWPPGAAPRLVTTGCYRATLSRIDGAWKLVELVAKLDGGF
ncbi:nuclear transport factor 2 family protein [Paraburkholderia sp. BL25I1N1]|uniref:nuclear transport factor 2 family protein n=1 Tax=Paraburkholderia sp. BL25I1N1 TaxID=1938804 RepID=UPI0015E6109C|nr:nuclear transport factor 2 family protein [Paraburkholderia sp. BL25I1N1]